MRSDREGDVGLSEGTFPAWARAGMAALAAFSSLAALAACTLEPPPPGEAPPGAEAGVPRDGSPALPPAAGGDDDASAPVARCEEAETTALQAAVDAAAAQHAPLDFVVSVKTPACGMRHFAGGPSRYPATTLEYLGSAGKTYVAALVLRLAERGMLRLDDPASTWLEGVPGGDAVQVKHLLEHTSGIVDYFGALGLAQSVKAQAGGTFTARELAGAAFARPLEFAPGSTWKYSNTNYLALGVIAERVTGKALAQLVRDELLTPLGLGRTWFVGGGETFEGTLAVGKETGGTLAPTFDFSFAGAAGGVVAELGDAVTWIEALCTGRVVAPTSFSPAPHPVPNIPGWKYGYGLVTYDASITNGGGVACGHAGNWYGYQTETFYFPDHRTTLVGTFNGGPQAKPLRDELVPALERVLFTR